MAEKERESERTGERGREEETYTRTRAREGERDERSGRLGDNYCRRREILFSMPGTARVCTNNDTSINVRIANRTALY